MLGILWMILSWATDEGTILYFNGVAMKISEPEMSNYTLIDILLIGCTFAIPVLFYYDSPIINCLYSNIKPD